MLLVEPTFPLLLVVHHYFADPGCRLENIKAAPRSRISFASFCRSSGNTNCFVDMRYVILIHHVATIYFQGDTILTLWLPSRCRDPWSSRGWFFTRYKDNFVTKKDQVFRLPLKVWVAKSLLLRPLSTLLSRVDISSRIIILSVFFSLFLRFRLQFLFEHKVLTPTCLSCSHEEPRSCQLNDRAVWQSPCLKKDQLTRMGSCTVVRLGNCEAAQQAEAA